ncbi:nuclear transport factor 2 family protein [Bordetella genomosp. 13]|uniref:nuclear transport factor 2 family protein n=1 Tax=Bordetella genomosp. 13 TaxID=463040 RepID=UPI0011A946E6|nr:nuclear transport factor 2 family protein [Bordetella genomosp. 13]
MMTTTSHFDCLEVVYGFFDALDTNAHDRALALFAEDGVWERQGKALEGHAAIKAALDARSPQRRTFHAILNPVVSLRGENQATVRFYLMAYEAHLDQDTPQPLAPIGIRRCEDRLVHDGQAWRIARKSSQAHLPAGR